jgi:hydroxymethylbilane synthase
MHEDQHLTVATRGSLLARTQTEQTIAEIQKLCGDFSFEIIQISTLGDNVTDKPLVSFGGTGVFVKELENALISSKADFAVHSLKDVPNNLPEGLALVSFPKREKVNDVFLTRDGKMIHDMPIGFKAGTGSPRRIVQLMKMRPDAQFSDLRGNIDTRLRKLEEGQYDAIILAAAGLIRLGKKTDDRSFLPLEHVLPAIGQGAIAIECRADDKRTIEIVRRINDHETELAVSTERIFMKEIEGGCKFPLAAYARVSGNEINFDVMAGELKSGNFIRKHEVAIISGAADMAKRLAADLLEECLREGIKLHDQHEQS